jgi:putative endonuclease
MERRVSERYAYVYILANGYKKLYIGVTTKLTLRVRQHKSRSDPKCHTARYNINQLVYFETFTTVTAAIAREKQLKGWLRMRKLNLIISTNPDWLDLSSDWGTPINPLSEEGGKVGQEIGKNKYRILRFAQDDGSYFRRQTTVGTITI